MHTVLRQYSGEGASELFNEIESRRDDVEAIIRGVPGFVSYTLFRTDGGGVSLTVCNDKTGTDESSRRAVEWVKENVASDTSPPATSEGDTILQLS